MKYDGMPRLRMNLPELKQLTLKMLNKSKPLETALQKEKCTF